MKSIRVIGLCILAVFAIGTRTLAAKCPNGCAWGAAAIPSSAISEFPIPTAKSGPGWITAGSDGNMWFTEQEASKIGRITPSGTISEFPVPPYVLSPGVSQPDPPGTITAGPDGNLWFSTGLRIGRMTPSGTISEFRGAGSSQVAAGPDGNMWFTAGNQIGRITPSSTISEFPLPNSKTTATWITAGADGNVWFTAESGFPVHAAIGRITPSGMISTLPVASSPEAMTAGPDGNVWFAQNGKVGRITPSGTITTFPTFSSGSGGITAAADGNLWFLGGGTRPGQNRVDEIGRITPSGAISGARIVVGGFPERITAGPDGNLWFVERNGNKVGRIDPHLLTLAPSGCVVPKLRGKTLTQAGVLLERAHCVTGRLSGRLRKRKPIVVSQHPAAKTVLPFDGKVNLRLG
jgi:streptogramin lyase